MAEKISNTSVKERKHTYIMHGLKIQFFEARLTTLAE